MGKAKILKAGDREKERKQQAHRRFANGLPPLKKDFKLTALPLEELNLAQR